MLTPRVVLTILCAAAVPAAAEPTEISLGALAGGGSVDMFGMRYGTLDAGIDVSAVHFISPQIALGVRSATLVTAAFDGPHRNGDPVDRSVPWTLEPMVLARTRPWKAGPVRFGWQASASAGVAWLRTEQLCGGGGDLFEEHGGGHACVIVLGRSTEVTASAAFGAVAEAYHVALFVGTRAAVDTGGDRAAGLVANLGASF